MATHLREVWGRGWHFRGHRAQLWRFCQLPQRLAQKRGRLSRQTAQERREWQSSHPLRLSHPQCQGRALLFRQTVQQPLRERVTSRLLRSARQRRGLPFRQLGRQQPWVGQSCWVLLQGAVPQALELVPRQQALQHSRLLPTLRWWERQRRLFQCQRLQLRLLRRRGLQQYRRQQQPWRQGTGRRSRVRAPPALAQALVLQRQWVRLPLERCAQQLEWRRQQPWGWALQRHL